MKNLFILTITIIMCFNLPNFGQAYKSSWGLEFGGSYPRFVGITAPSYSATNGYGAFASLNRIISEHSGLRLALNYDAMHSTYAVGIDELNQKLTLFSGNFDYLYYFAPCEAASVYALLGVGGMVFTSRNSPLPKYNGTSSAYQINIGFGVEWRLSDDWNLVTELDHHTVSTNDIDGRDVVDNKGLFGSSADSYMKLNVGFSYYFSRGERSKLCDLYSGIALPQPEKVDYNKIEEIVKKYAQKEQKENVAVAAPLESEHWVLVGVEFEFNSARLTQGSYPMLFYTFEVLQNHPDIKVEIEGHTDNIGSNEFNMWLSQKRAQTVKDYLVSKGIDANRMVVKGYGEEQPRATNKSAEGRALNRRIEFKIIK